MLADDDRGRVDYTPQFVPRALADAWFDEIRRGVQWKSERRWMYDREVDTPRLVAHFPLALEARERAMPASIAAAA